MQDKVLVEINALSI